MKPADSLPDPLSAADFLPEPPKGAAIAGAIVLGALLVVSYLLA